jgi:hypothetical protein
VARGAAERPAAQEGEPPERGAYVRVWARDAGGRWWLVAEVTEPAS